MPNYLDERGLAALWEKIKSLGVDKANIIERLQELPVPTAETADIVEVEGGAIYVKISREWDEPTQIGDTLTIRQAFSVSQDGEELSIE